MHMRKFTMLLAAAAALSISVPALAGPSQDFHAVMDDYWATYLKDNPISATFTGVTTYDREVGKFTLAEFDRQAGEAAAFLARMDRIAPAQLTPADQANYAILHRLLSDAVDQNKFGERQILYSSNGSFNQFLASLGEQQPFHSYADYDNYLARISRLPEVMGNIASISAKGAREGYVQPCVTLGNGLALTPAAESCPRPAACAARAPA
jgi:uncharacterized protein (DUF885 family)